jgi:hypothetical protein
MCRILLVVIMKIGMLNVVQIIVIMIELASLTLMDYLSLKSKFKMIWISDLSQLSVVRIPIGIQLLSKLVMRVWIGSHCYHA